MHQNDNKLYISDHKCNTDNQKKSIEKTATQAQRKNIERVNLHAIHLLKAREQGRLLLNRLFREKGTREKKRQAGRENFLLFKTTRKRVIRYLALIYQENFAGTRRDYGQDTRFFLVSLSRSTRSKATGRH